MAATAKLAIQGGPKTVTLDKGDLFTWPIVTKEDEGAILDVVRRGAMSGNDISIKFEEAYCKWTGSKYGLAYCNGTASLLSAMWACGVRRGDEIIGPTLTYWASVLPALSLGATIHFADVEADSLCIDPGDIEHRIGPRTKAIVVVHLYGHPADMDPILRIARKHKLKVIEDASHAHGALYKGRRVGTMGDVGCFSLMAGKSLAIGEAGILVTNDRLIWERCLAFGFYERTGKSRWASAPGNALTDPELIKYAGLPMGGFKHRVNQTCTAMGLVQLRHYPKRMAEIQKAMNYFWERLKGCPGVRPHRIAGKNSTMGGWYAPHGHYLPEELSGLPVEKFCEAIQAEGGMVGTLANYPLHLHPLLREADIYGDGKPTILANGTRDVRLGPGSLPVAEGLKQRAIMIPWFKHCHKRQIDQYAAAVRKVAERAGELREAKA